MAVLHDYKCEQHGFFEGWEPVCPQGCTEGVYVVHLQAPGMKGDATKNIDKNLQGLADDFKMTNLKSTREGENQAGYYTRNNAGTPEAPKESRPGDNAVWGGGMNGLNMKNILAGRYSQSVRGEQVGIKPSEAGIRSGPRTDPNATFRDHQNLKIEK